MAETRGLNIEEPLLFERSNPGACGVDMDPLPEGFAIRTGQEERQSIGLPEVSEPQVIRHFVRLSQQNAAIDTMFYPLGSCTMKHNPRINEVLARLPGFALLHPLQPSSHIQGALSLMHSLQDALATLSGLPAVTLTPAAGAQGEMAGVMVIRKAQEAKGNPRNVILVADSAHGTNPATATMCGYETKTIPSNKHGIVDMEALTPLLNEDVAGIMITNPNTCGLFEPHITEIADMARKVGAYTYCDGANFNAIVGKIRPGDLGIDVMHFNLHKTFSTPHGGGGPGSGPIAVTKELEPFLPYPRITNNADGMYEWDIPKASSIGRMRGFHGQFGMMVRAWAFIVSHGKDGLKQVAEDAVLSANYIVEQLREDYHVPFPSPCMHECLLTDKKQREYGITTLDIAKTLIENGIHPMTMYFPLVVQGAMLIEPTESESKATLDRFIAVMRNIASDARNGKAEILKANPRSTPRRRLDEVKAARQPKLVEDTI